MVTEGEPAFTRTPDEPMVREPKAPRLIVGAPVSLASKVRPPTEKFWPSVVTNGSVGPFQAEPKWTLFVATGAKSASGTPEKSYDQLVCVAPVPVPPFQAPPARPVQ